MDISKTRNYYFDNVKFLLIFLVVTGHIIEPMIENFLWLKSLYVIIYSFHMPMFVFISGYFSKNIENTHIAKRITHYVLPYMIFQLLYSLFNIYILKAPNAFITFIAPYWIMWYMFSLLTWQLILPYFIQLKYPVILAIIMSLLAGMDQGIGYTLSLSRTIVFFPYFLMGYYFNTDIIKKYELKNYKYIAYLLTTLLIIILAYNAESINIRWLHGSYSYKQLNSNYLLGIFYRSLQYLLAIIFLLCILLLTPKVKTIFSAIGSKTVYIYLLHGFIIKMLVKHQFYGLIDSSYKAVFLILIAFLLCLILSAKPVRIVLKPILYPNFPILDSSKTSKAA